MNWLRKWSRILHRDIGYFFIGSSIIYGLSGIALNHLNDWNPNYVVEREQITTQISLHKSAGVKENVLQLLDQLGQKDRYKNHYYPDPDHIKIFLQGGSSLVVNTQTGQGMAEYLKKRAVFYSVNFLHYNPNRWWTWFSDIFAGALIFLAVTSLFMVRGKKGTLGRGGVYIALGIIIPILFLIFL
ncbi:MAG: PepSY-associated TM helix domain-containing protein [Candidatus Cyclobacteriaceae bacterium M3_2C_046]